MKKLNIGTNPNDGTGDTLRDAFKTINDNIDEVIASVGMKFNVDTEADIPADTYVEGDMGQIRNYNSTGKEAIALYTDNSNWVFFEQDRLAALGLKMGATNVESDHDIEVPKQTLSGDPAVVAADNRLLTVANGYAIELSLKEYVEQNFMENKPMSSFALVGGAPKMQMKVDDTNGVGAAMEVLYGDKVVAQMQWHASSQEFQFDLLDKTSGAVKATWHLKPDGHAYIGNKQVMTDASTEKMIREFRSTVVQDTAALHPTRAECIEAFKKLPHFDWAKDDDFYIKDAGRTKVVLVKYRANGATDEASAGDFWYEVLNKAK